MFRPAALALLFCTAPALALSVNGASTAATSDVAADPAVVAAVASDQRPEAERARDQYRHPVETLGFFGLKPDMTIVEIAPGVGWYANILAPVVAAKGQYIGAVPASPRAAEEVEALKARLAATPAPHGQPRAIAITRGGSWAEGLNADMVLTFRNVHNWGLGAGDMFRAFYAALKPGGVLGVVDHRLPEDRTAPTGGYLKESHVIALATEAGFRLDGRSDINANPKDSADHPKGVWTLPPTYVMGDVDRARYQAIGESDRMTLRFVKPAQ